MPGNRDALSIALLSADGGVPMDDGITANDRATKDSDSGIPIEDSRAVYGPDYPPSQSTMLAMLTAHEDFRVS